MLSAIRSNNVKKMQKCRGQLKAWPPHRRHCGAYIEEAIKLGHLEALQWLYWQLPAREDGGHSLAIEHNQRAILEWLMHHDKAYCGDHLLGKAIDKDDLELLEWLHVRGCHPRERTLDAAVAKNRVDLLEWLMHHDQAYCGDHLLAKAIEKGDLDLLEWLHARGCQPRFDTLRAAVRKNRVDLQEWVKARGAVDALTIRPDYGDVQHRLMEAAVRAGSLESLAWLHANDIGWDERTMKEAFDSLQPQILQHLHEHGCPWQGNWTWGMYGRFNSLSAQFIDIGALWLTTEEHDRFVACLRYLLAHGCPCDPIKRAGLLQRLGEKVLLPRWRAVVRWMIRVRPYAWHWLEAHQKAQCAPDGEGRKRDRERFEADFA